MPAARMASAQVRSFLMFLLPHLRLCISPRQV